MATRHAQRLEQFSPNQSCACCKFVFSLPLHALPTDVAEAPSNACHARLSQVWLAVIVSLCAIYSRHPKHTIVGFCVLKTEERSAKVDNSVSS